MKVEDGVSENESIAARTLRLGVLYPYACRFKPQDVAERAALGICADLCDRAGIKRAMEEVDNKTRREIVRALADIIRAAAVP